MMKKSSVEKNSEIRFVSDSERIDMQNYIAKYNKKLEKNDALFSTILKFFRYAIYTPLSIASNIISFVFKIGGSISAIGIPYGLYCAYIMAKKLYTGARLEDIKQTTFVCLFLIFPFIAFALSFIFEKLSDYLTCHK